jgi:predicted component of type VI protein secretion system
VHSCHAHVLIAADYVELGPRLKRSILEYVILQGWHFRRKKWQRLLQRCSRRPGLVPRWTGWRLLFASDDFFLRGTIAESQMQLHALPCA